ncbi:MAG: DUF1622 domain-containing protein [Actinomycetota bacterium]|nr:DUF1622 domain-containing protein [Actinomycetota bacterium]
MTRIELLQYAALVCTLLGLVSGAAVLARTRDLQQGLGVLLEFLLAAGLLRLSTTASWRAVVTAAVIVGIRTLVTRVGLRKPAAR